jgi:hypothetical protein
MPMAAWIAMRPGRIRPARIEPRLRFSTSLPPWMMAQADGCRTDRAMDGGLQALRTHVTGGCSRGRVPSCAPIRALHFPQSARRAFELEAPSAFKV